MQEDSIATLVFFLVIALVIIVPFAIFAVVLSRGRRRGPSWGSGGDGGIVPLDSGVAGETHSHHSSHHHGSHHHGSSHDAGGHHGGFDGGGHGGGFGGGHH
ncbi:MAG TPA: hypothetical protein VKV04_17380 [Verrucomicrobiae bacterium]|nr:hypothetical protein [Verrucomicrobiae bacterium]